MSQQQPGHGLEHYRDPVSGELLAMVVRATFKGGKYNFFTPDDFPLQMGTSFYPAGERRRYSGSPRREKSHAVPRPQ